VALLDLRCPNGCPDGRFEALNAPMVVDRAGRYVEHDARSATYVCMRCQAVAIDVGAAARAMHEGEVIQPIVLECPACGTEMLPPDDDPDAPFLECPACGARFAFEEGMRRLHGGGTGGDADL
jgi:DNA-directed RNA polymerase subunit RPC12/RpoP